MFVCTRMYTHMTNDNKLDERFDLRADRETREKLQRLSDVTGKTKSEIVRRLVKSATPEDILDAESE